MMKVKRRASVVLTTMTLLSLLLSLCLTARVGATAPDGVHLKGHFSSFKVTVAELPLSLINESASCEEVESITPDKQVEAKGHVTSTTGADLVTKYRKAYPSGILFTDGVMMSDTTTARSTNYTGKNVLVNGDDTPCMK